MISLKTIFKKRNNSYYYFRRFELIHGSYYYSYYYFCLSYVKVMGNTHVTHCIYKSKDNLGRINHSYKNFGNKPNL